MVTRLIILLGVHLLTGVKIKVPTSDSIRRCRIYLLHVVSVPKPEYAIRVSCGGSIEDW